MHKPVALHSPVSLRHVEGFGLATLVALILLGGHACNESASKGSTGDEDAAADGAPVTTDRNSIRPRSDPMEFVGMTVSRKVSGTDLLAELDKLGGDAARAGGPVVSLRAGATLQATPDSRSADQFVLTMRMKTSASVTGGVSEERTLCQVPMSFAYADVYRATVAAALKSADDRFRKGGAEETSDFFLEYMSMSVNGGRITLRMDYDRASNGAKWTVTCDNPRTSLQPQKVNQPAFEGTPYETVGGTVWFTLSRDEFDFFVDRAYGFSAGANQNFRDFRLLPHDWLRLTVTPRLKDKLVDVAFEVAALDGRRLALAKAPASFLGGEQFKQNVFRMVDDMLAEEEANPGSSLAWEAPFYYDDPEGGGVVRVVAQGQKGVFRIAYAVDSPVHYLNDVSFLPYTTRLDIPDELPPPRESACTELGSVDAIQGRFAVKFDASRTVRNSKKIKAPLKGHIWGDIFKAEDVDLGGPKEGVSAVGSFHFRDVDLTDPSKLQTYDIDVLLPAGEYQLLGFIDIDGTANLDSPGPDEGDPVTLAIGSFPLKCERQPITVEFALLLPGGY